MPLNILYFIYGLSVMFFSMMAWMFRRRGDDRLSRLVMTLMMLLAVQCVVTVLYLDEYRAVPSSLWYVVTGAEVVAVPMYAFILFELCRPGMLTLRTVLTHEFPFVALIAALVVTHSEIVYDVLIWFSAIYGCTYAVWTMVNIPRYHRRLRESFSYVENINLNWLRFILASFFILLGLWFLCSVTAVVHTEVAYMLSSLVVWMFVCYFLYRHESVLGEFRDSVQPVAVMPEECESELAATIRRLFESEKIYLNPRLKLSDVARMAGSNRTYISNYFNTEAGASFYEFTNRMRVDHACRLLQETDMKVKDVALQSGFNSPSTFHRVFQSFKGVSPKDYRINITDC